MVSNYTGLSESRIASIRKQIDKYQERLGLNNSGPNTSQGTVANLINDSSAGAANGRFIVKLPNTNTTLVTNIEENPNGNQTNNSAQGARSNVNTRFPDRNGGVRSDDKTYFDTNNDGTVSNEEALSYLVRLRQRNRTGGLEGLAKYNENTNAINNYLSSVDTSEDGRISNRELVGAMLSPNYQNVDENIRDLILKLNENHDAIEEAVSIVDVSGDNQISNIEALNALVHIRKRTFGDEESEFIRAVVESNVNHNLIEADLDQVDKNGNGTISRDEIWSILRAAKQGEINQATLERLTPIMQLNENFQTILEEFNNSIEGKYDNAQLYEAQALITKRLQQAEMRSHNIDGALVDQSLQMILEELASIYGDNYLSEDETSPDYYNMDGISGETQQRLLAEGYDMDTIINGTAGAEDIQRMSEIILDILDREDVASVVNEFDEQHSFIQSYIGSLKESLLNPLDTREIPSLALVLEDIAYIYGDLGFAGDENGFSGFTGALAAGLNNQDIFNDVDSINLNAIQQIQVILANVLGEEIDTSTFIEDNIKALARHGELDILNQATGEETLSQNLNGLLLTRFVEEGLNNDELFTGLGTELNAEQKTAAIENLNSLVDNMKLDVNSDGVIDSSDLELIVKYLNGVRGEDLTNTLITDDNPYTMTSFLEMTKSLEEYLDQSFLGAMQTMNCGPDIDCTTAEMLYEVAIRFGDSFSMNNGEIQTSGITEELQNALTEYGIGPGDSSRVLSRFDMQFIQNTIKEITGFEMNFDIYDTKHGEANTLVMEQLAMHGTEDALSFENFFNELANIYGDEIDLSSRFTFTGFTGVIAISLDGLINDVNEPISIEALNILKSNFDDLLNTQGISDELLPMMNKFSETNNYIHDMMQKLAVGASAGSIADNLNLIANIFGDSEDTDNGYTGVTGDIYGRLDAEGVLNSEEEINNDVFNIILDEISNQTNGYNLNNPSTKSIYGMVSDMKEVQHLLFDRMNEAAFEVEVPGTGQIPTLASVIAEVENIIDNEAILSAFNEILSNETYDLEDDVHTADYAALNMIYGAITKLFALYEEQGMVDENIEAVTHDRSERFSDPEIYLDANSMGGVTALDTLSLTNFLNDPAIGEGIKPGDPAWDPRKDTNKDGIINNADLELVVNYLNTMGA